MILLESFFKHACDNSDKYWNWMLIASVRKLCGVIIFKIAGIRNFLICWNGKTDISLYTQQKFLLCIPGHYFKGVLNLAILVGTT